MLSGSRAVSFGHPLVQNPVLLASPSIAEENKGESGTDQRLTRLVSEIVEMNCIAGLINARKVYKRQFKYSTGFAPFKFSWPK
jgi:hypothetical protein